MIVYAAWPHDHSIHLQTGTLNDLSSCNALLSANSLQATKHHRHNQQPTTNALHAAITACAEGPLKWNLCYQKLSVDLELGRSSRHAMWYRWNGRSKSCEDCLASTNTQQQQGSKWIPTGHTCKRREQDWLKPMFLAAVVHGMEPRTNQTPLLKPDRKVSTVDLFLLFQPLSFPI